MTLNKSVLTIATGKPIYIQMAINLARSFKLWHQDSNIKFTIATDQADLIPPDLLDIQIIELQPNQYGQGFSPKLHLDTISTSENTLFIDADCLCVGSLESVFERFKGHSVSVTGKTISSGDFFGDVKSICERFAINYLPYFVGGLYYFEKSDLCTKIFDTARKLESQYDEIGLVRLRGRPNEEPLMAISMAIHGQTPILEDGSIKAEPMFYPSGMTVDVIRGKATLYNSLQSSSYCSTWGVTKAQPLIIHFHCTNAERSPYTRECLKLTKIIDKKWNYWVANIYCFLRLSVPQLVTDIFKDTFRPLYKKFFGIRPILASQRIIK